MLTVKVPQSEFFDEETDEFFTIHEQTLTLEHSLVAIAKWESKYHKSFFSKTPKTGPELIEYYRCMTITQNVNPFVYMVLGEENIKKIQEYMEDPMTATTIKRSKRANSGTITTSDTIYYLMIQLGIPFECQKWHINRLLTLIEVCEEENKPKKKMSNKQILSEYSEINAARRARMHSKG